MSNELSRFVRREPSVPIAYGVLAVIVVLWLIVTPHLTVVSLTLAISQKLAMVLAAIGATAAIASRGIDLSIGGIVSLANVMLATGSAHGGTALWIVLALLAGLAVGLINGLLIAWMKLPPLIVTLATQSVLLGVSLYILPSPGGSVADWLTSIPLLLIGPIPLTAILLVAIPMAFWWPLRRSRWGTWLLAVGNDESAAFVSGIDVRRTKTGAYMVAGLFAALAGVALTMNTGAGDASVGVSFTLSAIAASVIGGAALAGGRASVAGTIAGALVLSFLTNLLFGLGISAYWQHVVTGVILLVALAAPAIAWRIRPRKAA